MTTRQVTDQNFEHEVLKAPGPVLVDFWAQWCGPCLQIAPLLEDLAKDMEGRVTVGKLNVDENHRVPAQYGVRGIPNLILFKNGQVRDQIIGAVPKAHLVKAIDQVV